MAGKDKSDVSETLAKVFAIAAGDKLYKASVERVWRDLERLFEKRKMGVKAKVILTYGREGEPVGFAILVEVPEKMRRWQETFIEEGWVDEGFEVQESAMELAYLYVQPDYRRLGRASELLVEVLEWARSNDVGSVYAYVSDRRNVALDFYLANGAEVIAEFSDDDVDEVVPGNGKPLKSAFLRWKLG